MKAVWVQEQIQNSVELREPECSKVQLTCSPVQRPRGAAGRRAQALYDCQADHHDELSFTEGQVLVVVGQEDSDWWVGVSSSLIGGSCMTVGESAQRSLT